jgi:hypothetical protein
MHIDCKGCIAARAKNSKYTVTIQNSSAEVSREEFDSLKPDDREAKNGKYYRIVYAREIFQGVFADMQMMFDNVSRYVLGGNMDLLFEVVEYKTTPNEKGTFNTEACPRKCILSAERLEWLRNQFAAFKRKVELAQFNGDRKSRSLELSRADAIHFHHIVYELVGAMEALRDIKFFSTTLLAIGNGKPTPHKEMQVIDVEGRPSASSLCTLTQHMGAIVTVSREEKAMAVFAGQVLGNAIKTVETPLALKSGRAEGRDKVHSMKVAKLVACEEIKL